MLKKLNAIRILAIVSVAFSVWFYWLTLDFPRGAAILPRALLILFAACAAILFVRSCLGDHTNENLGLKNRKRLLTGVGIASLYVVGIFVLGYYLASALFIITFALILGYRKSGYIAMTAILYPLSIYVVFQVFLKIPMPASLVF